MSGMFARLCALALAVSWAFPSVAADNGTFHGEVVAKWLPDGRRMELVEGFAYVGPDGERWEAPAGSIIDGASIPRVAWVHVGGPFEGLYRDASVIHDVACDTRTRPWQAVHLAFFYAMRARGVPMLKAKQMYAAVYHFGPRWPRVVKSSVAWTRADAQEGRLRAQARPGEFVEISRTGVGGASSCDPKDPDALCDAGDTRIANLTATYKPPPVRPESDFATLQDAIAERDLTIKEIQDFWESPLDQK